MRQGLSNPGESNSQAKFTDGEIQIVLELAEAGLTYEQIAAKWDAGKTMSKSTVAAIVQGRRRGVPTPNKRKA